MASRSCGTSGMHFSNTFCTSSSVYSWAISLRTSRIKISVSALAIAPSVSRRCILSMTVGASSRRRAASDFPTRCVRISAARANRAVRASIASRVSSFSTGNGTAMERHFWYERSRICFALLSAAMCSCRTRIIALAFCIILQRYCVLLRDLSERRRFATLKAYDIELLLSEAAEKTPLDARALERIEPPLPDDEHVNIAAALRVVGARAEEIHVSAGNRLPYALFEQSSFLVGYTHTRIIPPCSPMRKTFAQFLIFR